MPREATVTTLQRTMSERFGTKTALVAAALDATPADAYVVVTELDVRFFEGGADVATLVDDALERCGAGCDAVFQREDDTSLHRNLGFMVLRSTPDVRRLFEAVGEANKKAGKIRGGTYPRPRRNLPRTIRAAAAAASRFSSEGDHAAAAAPRLRLSAKDLRADAPRRRRGAASPRNDACDRYRGPNWPDAKAIKAPTDQMLMNVALFEPERLWDKNDAFVPGGRAGIRKRSKRRRPSSMMVAALANAGVVLVRGRRVPDARRRRCGGGGGRF